MLTAIDLAFIEQVSDVQAICAIQDTKPDICRDYPPLDRDRRCLRGIFRKGEVGRTV